MDGRKSYRKEYFELGSRAKKEYRKTESSLDCPREIGAILEAFTRSAALL
jgi:hypothetical protein